MNLKLGLYKFQKWKERVWVTQNVIAFEKNPPPPISLHCKLVLVQYWEYEYGPLSSAEAQGRKSAERGTRGRKKDECLLVEFSIIKRQKQSWDSYSYQGSNKRE